MSSLRLRQEGRLLKAKYPLGLTPRILQRRWTGKSFFAASMKRNFIDFPPWRKKLRPFSGFRALAAKFRSHAAAASAPRRNLPDALAAASPSRALDACRSSDAASKGQCPDRLRSRAASDRSSRQGGRPPAQTPA